MLYEVITAQLLVDEIDDSVDAAAGPFGRLLGVFQRLFV